MLELASKPVNTACLVVKALAQASHNYNTGTVSSSIIIAWQYWSCD